MTEKPRDPGLKFVGNSTVIALKLELSLKTSSRKFHAPTTLQDEFVFPACSSALAALALAAGLPKHGKSWCCLPLHLIIRTQESSQVND